MGYPDFKLQQNLHTPIFGGGMHQSGVNWCSFNTPVFGGSMHQSGIDLCSFNTPMAQQASWNLFTKQVGADLSVSNGWNAPLFGCGGGVSYMDSFRPNINYMLDNASWNANQYYFGGGAGTTPGAMYCGGFTPGVYGPVGVVSTGNTTTTVDPDTNRYDSLKSKVENLIISTNVLTQEEKQALSKAIEEADKLTTGAEKLAKLNEIINNSTPIQNGIKEALLATANVDDKRKLGLAVDANLGETITKLNEYLNTTAENPETEEANEAILNNLSKENIIEIISEYNGKFGNIFNGMKSTAQTKIKVLLEECANDVLKNAEGRLSEESLSNFRNRINSATSQELYADIRLISAMIKDFILIDTYGDVGRNVFAQRVVDDLHSEIELETYNLKDENGNYRYQYRTGNTTLTTGATEVSGTTEVENGKNENDLTVGPSNKATYTNEDIEEFLGWSNEFSEPIKTDLKDASGNTIYKVYYRENKYYGEDSVYTFSGHDKVYYIVNGQLLEGNENGPNEGATCQAQKIKKEIQKLYNYDLKDSTNHFNLRTSVYNETFWDDPEAFDHYSIGELLSNTDCYGSAAEGTINDRIDSIAKSFQAVGYSSEIIEEAAQNTKDLYEQFFDNAGYYMGNGVKNYNETFTLTTKSEENGYKTSAKTTYHYGVIQRGYNSDMISDVNSKVDDNDIAQFENNGSISTGIVRGNDSAGHKTTRVNYHILLMHFMDQLQKVAKSHGII